MKTLKLLSVSFLFLFILSVYTEAKNDVNSETTFGTYKVSATELTHSVTKNKGNTYTIYYEEYEQPVTVSVFEGKNCKNYVVRAENFEVQYTCNGRYFGIKYVDDAYAEIPRKVMVDKIDRKDFLYQRVITQKNKSEKEFVRLIACFLPEIMTL